MSDATFGCENQVAKRFSDRESNKSTKRHIITTRLVYSKVDDDFAFETAPVQHTQTTYDPHGRGSLYNNPISIPASRVVRNT